MATSHQKVDHGGNFFQTPRRLIDSVAWRELSGRAAKVLMLFQSRHNGYNNGKIGFSIHAISAALGNQNHASTAKAVVELIQKGFIECTSDADRRLSKAREYRLTFIPSGERSRCQRATHEYLDWRPSEGRRRKFGGARIASNYGNFPSKTTRAGKVSGIVSSTHEKEIAPISVSDIGAETAPHLGYHPMGSRPHSGISGHVSLRPGNGSEAEPTDELRPWLIAVLVRLGHGGQKELSDASRVPQPIICKFKNGRGLPAHYHIELQSACGRIYPYKEWKASFGQTSGSQAGSAR
jgi:hypothetical protein